MSIISIEPQLGFPREDLTDANAELLELLLLHQETVDNSHTGIEGLSFLYKVSHRALDLLAQEELSTADQFGAFSYGITVYEALVALVTQYCDIAVHNSFDTNCRLIQAFSELKGEFIARSSDEVALFSAELPRAATVIGISAMRFCGSNTRGYALAGAATARRLELDAA